MSIEMWTDPKTKKQYPIGTIGLELNKASFKILDILYETITLQYPKTAIKYIDDLFLQNGAYCPTYGLWAGKGWASGSRYSGEQNPLIIWATEPCYNENINFPAGSVMLTEPVVLYA
ncbi:MAG: hypothetical protein ACYDGO_08020 [Smithellaceae bacterium]